MGLGQKPSSAMPAEGGREVVLSLPSLCASTTQNFQTAEPKTVNCLPPLPPTVVGRLRQAVRSLHAAGYGAISGKQSSQQPPPPPPTSLQWAEGAKLYDRFMRPVSSSGSGATPHGSGTRGGGGGNSSHVRETTLQPELFHSFLSALDTPWREEAMLGSGFDAEGR